MSENIENTVQKEDAPNTQEPQTSQPSQDTQGDAASAAGNNVVPYPVSDKQKQTEAKPADNPANTVTETITETIAETIAENTHSTAEPVDEAANIAADEAADEAANIAAETVTSAAESVTSAVEGNASAGSEKSRTSHYEDPDDIEELEEDFYEQQEKSRTKDEHPFREFFSNFRSKRKIEMNRDEQILSRISDDDLMEYLRMEQKRMELLQQAKEVREKRFWTTFQLFICLLSVILVIYFLKDNPVILVTILYTIGILTALRIWSKSQNGRDHKDGNDSSGHHKKPWE